MYVNHLNSEQQKIASWLLCLKLSENFMKFVIVLTLLFCIHEVSE